MFAVTVDLCLYQRRFVEVFSFLFFFIYPKFGKHFGYLVGHEPGEYCIARVLGCCGEDAVVYLFGGIEVIGQQRLYLVPLVEAEIVYQYEQYFFAVVESGEDFCFEQKGSG